MQEEDFRARLDAELDEALGPPLGTLVAAAASAGERRRRHRAIAQLATGTAGVAAVVLGAVAVAGAFGPDSRGAAATSPGDGSHAAGPATQPPTHRHPPPPASTPTVTPTPAPSTAASTPWPVTSTSGSLPTPVNSSDISGLPKVPPGQARTTAQAMILLLEQNVGKTGVQGDFSHTFGYAPDGSPGQTQKTTFMADLYWNHSTVSVSYTLPPKNPPHVKPGGDVFRWDTPGVSGTSEVKLAKGERGVEVTRPDGSKVMVLEINGRENGNFGPDRPDMPLTSDQLLAIAQDPHWGPTMSEDFVAQAQAVIQVAPTSW